MFDVKWIKENPDLFDKGLARRGLEAQSQKVIELDDARKATVQQMNEWQEKRNTSSKLIGQAKASGDEEKAQSLLSEVATLKSKLQEAEEKERVQTEALTTFLAGLPNLLLDDVPDGADENDNVEVSRFKAPKQFDFTPKEHYELGEQMGLMDFETAAKIAGSRFVVLKGALARLERALGQYMLDLHTDEHGFTEIVAPLLVRSEALYGTGQLPKFSEDAFKTTDERWLIPTSEVSLTNLVRERMLSENELPLRFCALTPCFRSEAGSAGRDTRGMLRQHQFYKVEMVAITTPDTSLDENERMRECAQAVLKNLDIPYRVMRLCAGDMGATMKRTYDLEAFMPGQDTYREISSVSVAGDYQARRMDARYRDQNGKAHYVHTLNGSGVATGRALIAVMENYQNVDGSITVPEVLRPYMGNLDVIKGA